MPADNDDPRGGAILWGCVAWLVLVVLIAAVLVGRWLR
jgi:hypothetical protein